VTAKPEQPMAEIERQIARTRAELGLTLDALAIELAPRHLVEQGVKMITDFFSANRPGGISFGAAVRADPVPLALIGLGIAWLVAENIGLLGSIAPSGHGAEDSTDAGPAERIGDRTVEPATEGRQNGGEGWIHRAAGAAQGALRSICSGSGAVLESAGDYIGKAVPSGVPAGRAGGWLIESLESNPLLLGVAGLAAGAVVSMLLPPTRRERDLVAQAREDLWERAEELGHRAADGVRAMAEGSTRPPAGG
jgi:Protein of unknown function (DUF3618)